MSIIQIQSAILAHQQGNFDDAEKSYRAILVRDPNNFKANYYLGVLEYQKNNYQKAIDLIKKALGSNPKFAEAYSNLALSYKGLGNTELAITSFNKAIEIEPNSSEAYFNLGNLRRQQGEFKLAIECYKNSIQYNKKYNVAFYNLAICYEQIHQIDEAIKNYDETIKLKPDFIDAYANLAQLQLKKGMKKEAFVTLYKIIEINPKNVNAYFNLAMLFKEVLQYESAVKALKIVKNINPNFEQIDSWITYFELFESRWDEYNKNIKKLKDSALKSRPDVNPFIAMIAIDDPLLQYNASRAFVRLKGLEPKLKLEAIVNYQNSKIRIGYYSSDLFKHATAYLMSELFELHDRDKFETHIFSYGSNVHDEMTQRIKDSCDYFYDVKHYSSQDIANLSRECKIDIAIDLKGYTGSSRSEIFSYRPAPIQVNYLGFPGTLANPNFEYIIADETIIPKSHQHFYSEKVAYLPNSYQVNDRKRKVNEKIFTRQELGLPNTGFVFCCFNYNYKITPIVFDVWTKILNIVEGSVLWLLEDSKDSTNNLLMEASKRGIHPNRLIFAPRIELSLHLSRHRAADLFLDTWPCNAHTTASDALWAGLPVITLLGETFASRVCGSLLNAINLSELITNNVKDYEALAIELATNKQQLLDIKRKLIINKDKSPLFDTAKFVKDLEEIYVRMQEKHLGGLSPNHIYLDQAILKSPNEI
jgi:predicted O-linked N-acetylglucosamine transferase (SPINDLY family)